MTTIDALSSYYGSAFDLMSKVRDREFLLAESFSKLYEIAKIEKDSSTQLLHWFTVEQLLVEADLTSIIFKIDTIRNSGLRDIDEILLAQTTDSTF